MKKLRTCIILFFLFSCLSSRAQFYSTGDEDGRLKWMQTETPHYQIIYPKGLDSLSFVYARQLERYWGIVGNSAGYHPGEFYRHKTPVVLHSQHGISNGSVVLAPMRMDLFTLPQAYNPGPMPWEQSLAVHESRHVSQMQFGRAKALKPFNWIFGEMFSGAMTAVYPNLHFLEGDAVVAETALTRFGRGREAQFLNYYMSALDEGDERNWYQWRYGSYKHFAPDHYALGYLTLAGARYCYGEPEFTQKYFDAVTRRPYRFAHLPRTMKEASGKKFKDSFKEIQSSFHQIWKDHKEERKPFDSCELIMKEPKWFSDYSEICTGKDGIYALKKSKVTSCQLVHIDFYGKEKTLHPFSNLAGGLYLADNKLWWSESIPDPRWNLKMKSIIRYMDLDTRKIHNLTEEGRLFNPCPSPDRKLLAAAAYDLNGQNKIVLLDSKNGNMIHCFNCPDGMQPVEFTWEEENLFFNAITKEGTGIYQLNEQGLKELLSPQPIQIRDLSSEQGKIYFASDRNGVSELYEMDSLTGNLNQLTSLEYGGNDFCFNVARKEMFFTSLNGKGNLLYRISTGNLHRRAIRWEDIYEHPVAATLTEQEKSLAEKKNLEWPEDHLPVAEETISQPRPYRKYQKLFHLHSWVPLYIDGTAILQSDFGKLETASGLGATAFFQSILGDFSGSVGYQYGPTGINHEYRSSGHLAFTYRGFYPVFNFNLDFGEREAMQYDRKRYRFQQSSMMGVYGNPMSHPSVHGTVMTYLPLNFSSSGWQRGLIPKITYSFSNDVYHRELAQYDLDAFISDPIFPLFIGYEKDRDVFLQSMEISLRSYCLQGKAPAKAFPQWGIEGEMGWYGRLGLTDIYSSSAYCFLRGYLPGIMSNQGMMISLMGNHQFGKNGVIGESRINTSPRGFNGYSVQQFIASHSTDQINVSLDYSIPLYLGDISWFSPLLYIKNLELRPYIDGSFLRMRPQATTGHLFSVGSELTIHAANFLWVPYPTTLGITCCYNFGNLFDTLKEHNAGLDRTYLGFIMKVSL